MVETAFKNANWFEFGLERTGDLASRNILFIGYSKSPQKWAVYDLPLKSIQLDYCDCKRDLLLSWWP